MQLVAEFLYKLSIMPQAVQSDFPKQPQASVASAKKYKVIAVCLQWLLVLYSLLFNLFIDLLIHLFIFMSGGGFFGLHVADASIIIGKLLVTAGLLSHYY